MEAFSEDWDAFTASDERLTPVRIASPARLDGADSLEWGNDEANDDITFEINDIGRNTGSNSVGGGEGALADFLFSSNVADANQNDHHASSFSPGNLWLDAPGGNLSSEVVPGDGIHHGQDEIASANDDGDQGLDDGGLIQDQGEGVEYHNFAAPGTPVNSNQNDPASASLEGASFFDDLGPISGDHAWPSPDTNNSITTQQNYITVGSPIIPNQGSINTSQSYITTNNPIISHQGHMSTNNPISPPQGHISNNNPISSHQGHISSLNTFAIEEPVHVSHVEVELVAPTPHKAITPVVAMCNTVKIVELDLTEEECPNPELKRVVSRRLKQGIYSCTGCYWECAEGLTIPNVLGEKCREKQRERRERLAAEGSGEAALGAGGQGEVGAGAEGSEAQSTASSNKRGASSMAGNGDVAAGVSKKARVTKKVAGKASEPIQRPANPLRKARGLWEPPAKP
ncbi:hypothetical protein QBC45DRAFT_462709 [Copromyces sp. CBS 386.78]|nr:hypothetical protein QBC45DRAFT_462709 [Copromyces sp. CBS 386.78]